MQEQKELLRNLWDVILSTQFDRCVRKSKDTGPGVNIFYIYQKSDSYNCEYNYITKESPFWKSVFNEDHFNLSLLDVYNNDKHVLICIYTECAEHNNICIGNARIVDIETKKDVC